MIKITVLGTGHGTATNCYNTCFALNQDKNEYFLVDAGGGNGIMVQLEEAGIPFANIQTMFISHTHTDHIMGAIWMIRVIGRMYFWEKEKAPFVILGNNEVIKALRQVSDAVLPEKFTNLFDHQIQLVEVDTGSTAEVFGKRVEFFDIDAQKVKQTGFKLWLNETECFTFIGDEVCQKNTEQYVQNSKWLFADAFMAGQEAEEYDPITRHHHSTVKYTASLAERLSVQNLILSHTMDNDLANRKKTFTEDAKRYFKGNVLVPDDLESFEIQ